MPSIPRRAVTGHDERGVCVFASDHRWENRSGHPARTAFILVDGAFTAELTGTLGEDVLGGLLHDPPHAPGSVTGNTGAGKE